MILRCLVINALSPRGAVSPLSLFPHTLVVYEHTPSYTEVFYTYGI